MANRLQRMADQAGRLADNTALAARSAQNLTIGAGGGGGGGGTIAAAGTDQQLVGRLDQISAVLATISSNTAPQLGGVEMAFRKAGR
jgi:hypothetical protein